VDKCLYQFSLESDEEITDLLAPMSRYVVFEIVHGENTDEFEEHEILSIHEIPGDCDRQELEEAIEDYYDFYFTNDEEILERAMLRLFDYGD
jgi:hypothetical protein